MEVPLLKEKALCGICWEDAKIGRLCRFCKCDKVTHLICLSKWRMETQNKDAVNACEVCLHPYMGLENAQDIDGYLSGLRSGYWALLLACLFIAWFILVSTVWHADRGRVLKNYFEKDPNNSDNLMFFYNMFCGAFLYTVCTLVEMGIGMKKIWSEWHRLDLSTKITSIIFVLIAGPLFRAFYYFVVRMFWWASKRIDERVNTCRGRMYSHCLIEIV